MLSPIAQVGNCGDRLSLSSRITLFVAWEICRFTTYCAIKSEDVLDL
ncbi:hypothetical protein PN466_11800 [Roseofilum reptotaenium CS-1145]|nr:hypothetical protein [Roseofilum sp. Guam]MBP0030166.1 hypothetical protein [Roseofilum sp. Guam]MDB9517632.1 hypothetical protein [Roseofilum reptotaenium CS-1145]